MCMAMKFSTESVVRAPDFVRRPEERGSPSNCGVASIFRAVAAALRVNMKHETREYQATTKLRLRHMYVYCPLRRHTSHMRDPNETRSMRALAALSLRTRTHAPHSTPHASSVEPPVAPRPPTASEGALSSASDKSPVPFTVLSKVVPPFSHGLTKVGAREDSSAEIQRRNRG